jgi:hypothetical protein
MNKKQLLLLFKFRKFILFFIGNLFFYTTVQGQFGLTTSNYAGLHHLQVNPANICFQPVTYEINIASIDANFNNNIFYSNPILIFDNNNNKIKLKNHRFSPDSLKPGNLLLYKDNQSNGYVFGSINLMGPSILIALNRVHLQT